MKTSKMLAMRNNMLHKELSVRNEVRKIRKKFDVQVKELWLNYNLFNFFLICSQEMFAELFSKITKALQNVL